MIKSPPKIKMKSFIITLSLVYLFTIPQLQATIVLPALFSDNMVLQQKANANVWGNAEIGQTIQIKTSWDNQVYSTIADANGKWKTKIVTPEASNVPYTIEFEDDNGVKKTLLNVLIGEVWLCSGQSNMVIQVNTANNPGNEVNDSNYPNIRFFQVTQKASITPVTDVVATWKSPNQNNVLGFPAIAFFYARNLYKHFMIPIGIVHTAFGSATQEAWLAEEQFSGIDYAEKMLSDARNGLLPSSTLMQQVPTTLYNAMFKPLVPYTVKGVCWYQGESNVMMPFEYKTMLNNFIQSWRSELEQPELPFFVIQLSGYNSYYKSGWPLVQEMQYDISTKMSGVSTIMTYDIGDSLDIHPKNKQDVAHRLFLAARKSVYGEDIIAQGPVMDRYTVNGSKVRIYFKNIGDGLVIKHHANNIRHFMLAGNDRTFYPANAVLLDQESIQVECDQIQNPKYIRYAYACYNADVNLYNSVGIPALPFRTDTTITMIRSSQSGAWTNPDTWIGGVVPTQEVDVEIDLGHTVNYYINSSASTTVELCKNLTVDGTLAMSNLQTANLITNIYGSVKCNGSIIFGQTGSAVSGAVITLRGLSCNISGTGSANLKIINLNVNAANCLISLPTINCTSGLAIAASGSKITVAKETTITGPIYYLSPASSQGQGTGVSSFDFYGNVSCRTLYLCNNATTTEKSKITVKSGGRLNITHLVTPLRGALNVTNTIGGSGAIFTVEEGAKFNWTAGSDPMIYTSSSNTPYDPKLTVAYLNGSVINGVTMTSDQVGGATTSIIETKGECLYLYYDNSEKTLVLSRNFSNLKVFDLTGNIILSKSNPDKRIQLDLIGKGIYIVALIDETNKFYYRKIIYY